MNQGYSNSQIGGPVRTGTRASVKGKASSAQLASRLDRCLTYAAGLFLTVGMGCFMYLYAPQELFKWSAATPKNNQTTNSVTKPPAATPDWYRDIQFKIDSANRKIERQMGSQQQLNNRLRSGHW